MAWLAGQWKEEDWMIGDAGRCKYGVGPNVFVPHIIIHVRGAIEKSLNP